MEVSTANKLGKAIAQLVSETKAKSVGVLFSSAIGNAGLTQCLLGKYVHFSPPLTSKVQ